MSTVAVTAAPRARSLWPGALPAAGRLWFWVMLGGQGLFLAYILAFYFPSTLSGHYQAWNRNRMLLRGYTPGDTAGNLAFAAHVLLASVVTFAGLLQLVPQIRAKAPSAHRWLGRVFLTAAGLGAITGLYMNWVRGVTTNGFGTAGITLNAVLILGFGALAWRAALRRDFAVHRKWAMRTFMAANGVFFIRAGFIAYAIVAGALTGGKPAMGPFFDVWSFGSYLVPLAGLELWFWGRERAGAAGQRLAAAAIFLLTLLLGLGGVGAWFLIWAPLAMPV